MTSTQNIVKIGSSCTLSEDYEVALNNWHFYNDGSVKLGDGVQRSTLDTCTVEPLIMLTDEEMTNFFNIDIPTSLPYSVTDKSGKVVSSSYEDVTHSGEDDATENLFECNANCTNEVALIKWHFHRDGNIQFGDGCKVFFPVVCSAVRQHIYESLALLKDRHIVENMIYHLTEEFPHSKIINIYNRVFV